MSSGPESLTPGSFAMEFVALSSLSACLLALLLAARVVLRPSDNPPAAWALALFLVSVSAFVADQIAYLQGWFTHWPHAYAVANPFIVAIFPSLHLYVYGVTHPTARWRRRSLAHLVAPLVVALLELPTYLLSAEEKIAAAQTQLSSGQVSGDEMVYMAVLNLYALGYLVLCWRNVHLGRQRLNENVAEGRTQSFRGLSAFVGLFTVLTATSAVLDFTPWRFTGSLGVALAAVVTAFTAFWLLADHKPLLAKGTSLPAPPPATPLPAPPPPVPPTAISVAPIAPPEPVPALEPTATAAPVPTLRPAEIDRLKRRLEKLFEGEKIHLDAELSLQGLADRADTTRHKMSAAIREIYGQTFYQLVAHHRVQDAAVQLQAKSSASRTISDIAFSVGFNTLSAFNAAFKAEFGVTPSKFRTSAEAATALAGSHKRAIASALEKPD